MRTWQGLYGMVWLAFFTILVAVDPIPPWWLIYVHAALGALLLLLAVQNRANVLNSRAPRRTKNTVHTTAVLAAATVPFALLLWLNVGSSWVLLFGYSVWDGFHIVHVLLALTILAQAASAATAYDMWEEREFEQETRPGELPPMPAPGTAPSTDPRGTGGPGEGAVSSPDRPS